MEKEARDLAFSSYQQQQKKQHRRQKNNVCIHPGQYHRCHRRRCHTPPPQQKHRMGVI